MGKVKRQTGLSEREKQVLTLLAEGNSNKEIAEQLNLSPLTVMAHRSRIGLKLNIHNLPALIKYAIENNLTSLDT